MVRSEYRDFFTKDSQEAVKKLPIPVSASLLRLTVKGTGSITINARLSQKAEDTYVLAGVNSSTYETVNSFTGDNMYVVEISGIASLDITRQGSVEVSLRLIY